MFFLVPNNLETAYIYSVCKMKTRNDTAFEKKSKISVREKTRVAYRQIEEERDRQTDILTQTIEDRDRQILTKKR